MHQSINQSIECNTEWCERYELKMKGKKSVFFTLRLTYDCRWSCSGETGRPPREKPPGSRANLWGERAWRSELPTGSHAVVYVDTSRPSRDTRQFAGVWPPLDPHALKVKILHEKKMWETWKKNGALFHKMIRWLLNWYRQNIDLEKGKSFKFFLIHAVEL